MGSHRWGVSVSPPASPGWRSLRRITVISLGLSLAVSTVVSTGAAPSATAASSESTATIVLGRSESPAGEASGPDAPDPDLEPPPEPGPFKMNLYSKGDFVHQATKYWCVAAAAQTMMNIVDDGKPNTSRAYQKRLHFEGRDLDQGQDDFWRRLAGESRWRRGLHGLGLRDWVGLLNTNGYGPYEVDRARTRKKAIRMAAKAIRMTGRPVGLVVWRGAHSWVMSGFTATADPAYTDDFEVKKVFIQDPWYPYVSTIWGASRPPDSAVPVARLGADYLPYNRPRRKHPMRDGKYMLILPALPRDGTPAS